MASKSYLYNMRKIIFLLVTAFLSQNTQAQVLTNNGAQLTIQSGAIMHVFGSVSIVDNGVNNAIVDNSGNFWVRNGSVGFDGDIDINNGSNVNLKAGSGLYVARNYNNNATMVADNGSTVFFNGTGQQNFTRGASANAGDSFYDVILQNTAGGVSGLQLPSGVTNNLVIRNQLNFDNVAAPTGALILTAANNYVYVQNTATTGIIGYGDNYYISGSGLGLDGRLRRNISTANKIIYPVGDFPSGKGHQLAEIQFTSLGDYTDVTTKFDPNTTGTVLSVAECGNDGYDAWIGNGKWNMEGNPVAVAKGNYNLTLYPRLGSFTAAYAALDYTQFTGDASTTIEKTPTGTNSWVLDGNCNFTSKLSATPIVIRDNIPTGFSDFQIVVDNNRPFPVEWLPLTATGNVDKIDLRFTTLSETNCNGFEVFKSTDGQNFTQLNSFIQAKGGQNVTTNYDYEDKDVLKDVVYYYKVRQLDYNGNTKFSNVAEAILVDPKTFSASVFPNPTQNQTTLQINGVNPETVKVDLYNNIGQIVASFNQEIQVGVNQIDITSVMNKVSTGTYTLQIQSQIKPISIRLVKIN